MGKSGTAYDVFHCQDCGTEYNPKQLLALMSNGGASASFGNLRSPIEEEIKDLEQEQLTFKQFPIVPFMDRSDAMLKLLRKVKTYSPTHGSCIASIGDYVLNGEFDVIRKKRNGFKDRNPLEEVSDVDFNLFIDFIESLNPESNGSLLLSEVRKAYLNYKTYGNCFIRMDLVEIAGNRYVYIYNVDAEMCRYWITLRGQDRVILISELWTDDYIQRHPPTFVDLFPHFTDMGDGVMSTIIHCSNDVEGRDWYGLPDSINSFFYQYEEYQLGDYTTKGYANRWTGDKYIETAGDIEGQDPHGEFRGALKKTFSNDGEGERIVHRHRNTDDPQTYIYEFKEDKSWEFHKHEGERAEAQIIKSHNWHKILMGLPTPGRLGGETGEAFREIYKNKYFNVIRPLQVKIMTPFNQLLEYAAMFLNGGIETNLITNDFTLSLGNLYSDILEMEGDEAEGEQDRTYVDYGIAVRAGAITPQTEDEIYFRQKLGIPEMKDSVKTAWGRQGGYRTPITLKIEEDANDDFASEPDPIG